MMQDTMSIRDNLGMKDALNMSIISCGKAFGKKHHLDVKTPLRQERMMHRDIIGFEANLN